MARQQWWTLAKADMNETAANNGHTLTWKRLPREAGHALVFEGTCGDCGATVQVGTGWSSCATIRNARDEKCSGPGTAVLTEIEAAHASEGTREAIGEYLDAIRDLIPEPELPPLIVRNPDAPKNQCGLMNDDGYTCTKRVNQWGWHKDGDDNWHAGSKPGADFTGIWRDQEAS